MKITQFQSKQSHIEDECRSCMDQHLPITLLQMNGSKSDPGEYSFHSTWKGVRVVPASAEQRGGNKAKHLVDKSQALLPEQNTESFAGKTYDHKEYFLLPSKETTMML